ncbi:hypothetical protein [Microcoleus sp. herbarium14]|uniref:hypothetical protein n=1 Tax=Microcoleus sp. herbarium14 TaxID=3055439 RepID=UPI002FD1E659
MPTPCAQAIALADSLSESECTDYLYINLIHQPRAFVMVNRAIGPHTLTKALALS